MTTFDDGIAEPDRDRPGVIARPPLIYGGTALICGAIEYVSPTTFLPQGLPLPLGLALIGAGIVVMALAMRAFRAAGTNVPTPLPAITVVTTGPYRFTRNPIYVGMTLIYVGIAAAADSLWLLAGLVPLLLVIELGVIRHEERYLARKFGVRYDEYRARVRRWI